MQFGPVGDIRLSPPVRTTLIERRADGGRSGRRRFPDVHSPPTLPTAAFPGRSWVRHVPIVTLQTAVVSHPDGTVVTRAIRSQKRGCQ